MISSGKSLLSLMALNISLLNVGLIFGLVTVLAGCSGYMAPEKSQSMGALTQYSQKDLTEDLNAYYQMRDAGGMLVERTRYRDKIVHRISSQIDANFTSFTQKSFEEAATINTVLDIAQIALGATGSLTGGAELKSILLATSAGITGSRSAFAKNFYAENSPKTIRLRMKTLRLRQWVIIMEFLRGNDDEYSLDSAAKDLIKYYNAGTVQAAYDDIDAQSGSETIAAQKSEQELQLLQTAEFKGLDEPRPQKQSEILAKIGPLIAPLTEKEAAVVLTKIPNYKPPEGETAKQSLIMYYRASDNLRKTDGKASYERLEQILNAIESSKG